MIRQLRVAALFVTLLLALSQRAGAVQLFIDQTFVHRVNANCGFIAGPPLKFLCPATSISPLDQGNISNEPHIEFDRDDTIDGPAPMGDPASGFVCSPGTLPAGVVGQNVCNSKLYLCAAVGYANETGNDIALSELNYELFKLQDGSNPLDPGSTPPLRTFFLDAPGFVPGDPTGTCVSDPAVNADPANDGTCQPNHHGPVIGPFCVIWDGFTNIRGEQGKTNGTYGFRVTAKTNVSGASGNIQITATRAYPAGATRDAQNPCPVGGVGCVVSQKPITVDVTNIHVVQSSATLVGQITPVTAQPYNFNYRLSKDASMYITVHEPVSPFRVVRNLIPGLPRVGEGTPQGTLQNGDSWNGRADNGDFLTPGQYLATFQALSADQYGRDLSASVTRQIALDPLQITDIRVQPLLGGSTSLAVLTYELTEPATIFIDIYPPNTQFCRNLNNLNRNNDDPAFNPPLSGVNPDPFDLVVKDAFGNTVESSTTPAKNFKARDGACTTANVAPVYRIVEKKTSRTDVISFWDGRDFSGRVLDDGDYIFVIYAALPSQNGVAFPDATKSDRRIWTSRAISGFLPIVRGFVGITQVTPTSSVVGSSPPASGLNPFLFRYTLNREGIVTMRIFDQTGTRVVKTLIDRQQRSGQFPNQERWEEPVDDTGRWVSSGTYLIQLTAADPLLPFKVSTVTALFPVNLFRLLDVAVTPLLGGVTDFASISYVPSQTMQVYLAIYPPGTVISQSSVTWPPCSNVAAPGDFPTPTNCAQLTNPVGQVVNPLFTFTSMKAGRSRHTEFWDGRDTNGLFVPDGNYVFTLTAKSTTTPSYYAADKVFGTISVTRGQIIFNSFQVTPDVPSLFNSSSTITLHPFTVTYTLNRQSSVTIQVLNTSASPQVIRTLFAGTVKSGGILLQDVWDGRDDRGNFPPSGFYNVRAVATDVAAVLQNPSTAQLTISYDPLRIYDVAVSPLRSDTGGAGIFYQVSETMKVAVKIYRPGTTFDSAGNPSPPEAVSLVKRIVGVRPARTEIVENWDGTDLRRAITSEGSYKFKIVGSTDMSAIDSITGNVVNAAALSLDRPIDEIPVVRGGSVEPRLDFENNTFVYPNPASGPTATFAIWSPMQARVKMSIYTINGSLVYQKDFGEVAAETYVGGQNGFVWNKTNASGRKLARGVYLAVIRLEETIGGKNLFQTVKRILIP